MSLRRIIQQLVLVPLRSGTFLSSMKRFPAFLRQWRAYNTAAGGSLQWSDLRPQLFDATTITPFDAHYFYQSAWCARKVAHQRPDRHVDIASQINMIGPLSAFVETEFIDFRPLETSLPGLSSRAGTILALPFTDRSVLSLSSLHVVEHIGLGRYGDPLDPNGTRDACLELQRILAVNGDLYLTTPVGRERVDFNAHRVHSPKTVIAWFTELELVGFSLVDDNGRYIDQADPAEAIGCEYALGMFHFRRNAQ